MKKETIILFIVYVICLVLWTSPIHNDQNPYGEGDASIHFFLSNSMVQFDKAILVQPTATSSWKLDNPTFNKNNWLINAPQYHTSLAIFQILSNKQTVGFYLFIAVMCSLSFFTIYIILNKLYNPVVGLIGAVMVMFSTREILTYIWGQWTTAWSFALVPLIMYAYFKYSESILSNKPVKKYLFLLVSIVVIQFLFHPLGSLYSASILFVYTIFLLIKYKKLPFKIKHVILCIFIFFACLIVLEPFQLLQIKDRFGTDVSAPEEVVGFSFNRIFDWYGTPGGNHGIPDFYFSFKPIYNGYWLLVPLLLGVLILLLKRNKEELLFLSSLITFYLLTHQDLIGIDIGPKYPRLFYFESIMFIPIIAIGVYYAVDLLNLKYNKVIKYARWSAIGIFGVLFFYLNVTASLDLLRAPYEGLNRINNEEVATAEWIMENIPEGSYLMLIGFPTFKQTTWFQALIPGRVAIFDFNSLMPEKDININKTNYYVIDYSFLYSLQNDEVLKAIQQVENAIIAGNNTLIYDDYNMKVYER